MTTLTELPAGIRPHPGDPAWRVTRRAVLDRDQWTCQRCGIQLEAVTNPRTGLKPASACVDHIVPIIRGGWHTPENLQALCLVCNAVKGNQVIDYRYDLVLAGELAVQVEARGIDPDTPVRYRRRDPGRELRTEKLNIAVTPTEKAWVAETFGSARSFIDLLTELLTEAPEQPEPAQQ